MSRFPQVRMRRLRRHEAMRKMLDLPIPGPEKFTWPVFVREGSNIREPIDALPGQFRFSIDQLLVVLEKAAAIGIRSVLIFGLPDNSDKDSCGSSAYDDKGIVQRAAAAVKKEFPELLVMTDVCTCAYTSHGHCGPLDAAGHVDNDATLEVLGKIAVSHAAAGADLVAPSGMMDGQVQQIRTSLDSADFSNTMIMSYSSKFTSSLYGPFREAEQSAPSHGDRKGYQASPASPDIALRESLLDIDEGADILMVKPALFYLDIIQTIKTETTLPLAAYNVSGEYSMIHAMADRGWGDLYQMAAESLTAISRSGADIILSYWAPFYDKVFSD